jgi:hypothetical protein
MSTTAEQYRILLGGQVADAASGKDMSIYSMEEYTQLQHVPIKID